VRSPFVLVPWAVKRFTTSVKLVSRYPCSLSLSMESLPSLSMLTPMRLRWSRVESSPLTADRITSLMVLRTVMSEESPKRRGVSVSPSSVSVRVN
jgi:hypothetical protein